MTIEAANVGIVVIGRNEGERLKRCLASCAGHPVVYVDSGSSDGSVDAARSTGAEVIELDLSTPFTAARARNIGWRHLVCLHPAIELIQFVDGDCELQPNWLATADRFLQSNANVVAVCGRLRERNATANIYHRLCDMEWDAPPGQTQSCGGIALMRVSSLEQTGGFRDGLIAGEEPELCLRLRRAGGTIHRLPDHMAWHDAGMTRFGQWWQRAVRAGYAYAEVSRLTQNDAEGVWRREARSTWLWGCLPVLAFGLANWTTGLSLLLLLGYPLLWLRIVVRAARRWAFGDAVLYATFCVAAKFAHLVGMIRYFRRKRTVSPSFDKLVATPTVSRAS